MSCVCCTVFAKRVTNLYRDSDLKDRYTELTGIKIDNDCFVCPDCHDKLDNFYSFKHQCIGIYQKLHPGQFENVFEEDEPAKPVESFQESSELYIISEANDTIATEDDAEENYLLESDEVEKSSCEQEIEHIYFEFKDEEEEDEPIEDTDKSLDIKTLQNESATDTKNVLNRKSYTVTEKLKIIAYAEENNNRQAARHFSMNESSVRCFRRQKDLLLKMSPQKKTNRKALPHWPSLENELKEFVLTHPQRHGTKAKLKDIKKEAIVIAEKHGLTNFNGSNSYIFKFMQRHQLPSASPRPRKQKTCTI